MDRVATTVVLDARNAVWARADRSTTSVLIAALSADPETLSEAADAARRFGAPADLFHRWRRATRQALLAGPRPPTPFHWIDLAARRLAFSCLPLPPWRGMVRYDRDADWSPYRISREWSRTTDWERAAWESDAGARRRRSWLIDHRRVLWGRACAEHLLRLAAKACRKTPSRDRCWDPCSATTRGRRERLAEALHADWLTSPRDDLHGRSPRLYALRLHEHVEGDLRDRRRQWLRQMRRPRPIPGGSAAYVSGCFSSVEHAHYFQWVRMLALLAIRLAKGGRRWPAREFRRGLLAMTQASRRWLQARSSGSQYARWEQVELNRRRIPLVDQGDTLLEPSPEAKKTARPDLDAFWRSHSPETDDAFVFSTFLDARKWRESRLVRQAVAGGALVAGPRGRTISGTDASDRIPGTHTMSDSHTWTVALNGLMRRYRQRVPDVGRAVDALVDAGALSSAEDIENDHIAFRTMGVAHLGLASCEKIFLHCGYEKRDPYHFAEKRLDAFWYAPPKDSLPRIFLSELRVADLSEEAQRIIRSYTDEVTADPVDALDLNDGDAVDAFLHQPLWRTPTWADYQRLASESEYAAWVIFNRYYLNHFTISVHNLPEPWNRLEAFNEILESRGLQLNDSGGKIKTSPDGLLRQSSTVAELVDAEFADGDIHRIPGSYVEFAERRVLPQYADLPRDQIRREHRRDGFEAANANRIFESTFRAQTGS